MTYEVVQLQLFGAEQVRFDDRIMTNVEFSIYACNELFYYLCFIACEYGFGSVTVIFQQTFKHRKLWQEDKIKIR